MSFCPECGEENPQGSKYCRRCGINLVYEEPKKETTAKKVTVETGHSQNNTINTAPRTNNTYSTNKNNNNGDSDWWCWGCCICMFFLFLIFAIAGH